MAKKKQEYVRSYCPEGLNEEVFCKIKQRRKQMLVHSHMYYVLGRSVLSDHQFDEWAYELRDLQREYPKESKVCDFAEVFKDWDGTTGYHLPYYPWVDAVAQQIMEYHIKEGGLL